MSFLYDNNKQIPLSEYYNPIEIKRIKSSSFSSFPKSDIVETFIALERTPLINNTMEILHTDGSNFIENDLTQMLTRLFTSFIVNYSYFHLKNTYYCSRNSFLKNNVNYFVDEMTNRMRSTSIYRFSFEHVIGISVPIKFFGDIWLGMIHRMTLLPIELYQKSVVICPTPQSLNWVKEVLDVLGTNSNLLHVPMEEYVFAENLYTVIPNWHQSYHDQMWHSFYGEPIWIFAETIRKKLGYNNVKPYRYVLTNREKGTQRTFKNITELQEKLNNTYPSINFEIVGTTWNSLRENVKDVVEMIWMFYITGSNAMRFVFMSPGTVAVQYMTEAYETQQFSMFASRGVYVIGIFYKKIKHTQKEPIPIYLEYTMKAIDRSLKTLQTQTILSYKATHRYHDAEWKEIPNKGNVFVTVPRKMEY